MRANALDEQFVDEPDARPKAEKSLRARAIDALARREHTRLELQRKLSPHTEDPEKLNALLDDLEQRGWLSDARYAEQRAHASQSRFGSRKIEHELRQQGVAESLISTALGNLKATEFDRALQVWQKKYGALATTQQERNKQMRFLQSRGFEMDVIYRVVNVKTVDE
ncbi:MAG: recombination regulator RecX [Sulfuriferula sp.]